MGDGQDAQVDPFGQIHLPRGLSEGNQLDPAFSPGGEVHAPSEIQRVALAPAKAGGLVEVERGEVRDLPRRHDPWALPAGRGNGAGGCGSKVPRRSDAVGFYQTSPN